jgi:hypothetical protein
VTYIDPQFYADTGPAQDELDEQTAAYPGGDDPLAGLNPTPEERLAFLEALDEQDEEEWEAARAAEEALDDDGGDPEGPWRDQLDALAEIGDQVDASVADAAVTAAEDAEDAQWYSRRPSAEARAARALDRIGNGTYTTPAYFRGDPAAAAAARDPLGRYQAACGPLDEFARCSARFHTPDCHTTIESAAARGSVTEVEAWNDTLQGRAQPPGTDAGALGLANEPQPGDGVDVWADLLETGEPGVSAPGLHARLLHYMGEADPPAAQPRPGLPDVAAVREALGI